MPTEIESNAYNIEVPTLFIGASKDFLIIEDANRAQIEKYAKNLRIESVNAGHYLHIERADEVNGLIENWLETTKFL